MLTCRAQGSECDSRCTCAVCMCEKCVCRRMSEWFVRRHRSCNSALRCPSSNYPKHAVENVEPTRKMRNASYASSSESAIMHPNHLSQASPAISIHTPSSLHISSGSSSRGRHTSIAHRFGFRGVAYHFDGISVSSKGGEVVEGRRWAWEMLHCYSV